MEMFLNREAKRFTIHIVLVSMKLYKQQVNSGSDKCQICEVAELLE
jgi:hypothetical protein